jgi:lysophospholipase L1-like esterase
VTARILDSGNNPVDSHSVNIAVGGDNVVAIGDSITNGIGDTYAADNDDASRVFSNTAYASALASRLEAMPPTEVVVYNEGIGGDTANDTNLVRLQSIIERHPSGSAALVQLGTNDAGSGRTAAAFESDMQSIVDRLLAESMTVYVATLPPILGGSNPLSSAANLRIVQYNDEITNNLAGAMPGADLWDYFAPDDTGDEIADRVREDLFADDLHPNALGHAIIADLWYNVLLGDSTGTTIVPFAVDALSRANYKQNLLEPGDAYLVDSAAVLTDVPAALGSAIWIMSAQSDAGSTATSFLAFDIDRSATVYIAYDADAALLPEWLDPATSGFVDTGQQLTTTQTSYRIFSAPFGAGNVSLGGNHAIGGGDAADMYLVGLLPGS